MIMILNCKLFSGIDVETGDDVSCFVVDVDMNKWLFVGKLMSDAESEKRKVIKKVCQYHLYGK